MQKEQRELISGVRATTLGTVVSRVLGLVRDMAIAALLGLSGGGVADALLVALRIPNLFRQIFGEGALTASYLPVLTERLAKDRQSAWQLASVMFAWLAVLLAAIVLLVELLLGALWLLYGSDRSFALLLGLSAVMFPYMLLVCLSAQVSATLNALGRFALPAFVPVVLNVVLIAGALLAPRLTGGPVAAAYLLAVCVLVGGVAQLGVQLPQLRSLGFRFEYRPAQVAAALKRIAGSFLPMILALAITQINTLLDSLIALGLSDRGGSRAIAWLGGRIDYPMRPGAAASIYYGERMYQLPLGILGVAVATVIFPLLSRHAALGRRERLGEDLTLGLRLVTFLSLPASLGLVMLAGPLSQLLFQHGQFTADDARRTARMVACFGGGVWAYCALPVLVRGYYALGRHATAVRIGLISVALNLALDLTLVWFLAEAGLAVATAISAAVQVVLLSVVLASLGGRLHYGPLAATVARSALATAVMGACGYAALWIVSGRGPAVAVAVPLCVSAVVYVSVYAVLGGEELRLLVGRRDADA